MFSKRKSLCSVICSIACLSCGCSEISGVNKDKNLNAHCKRVAVKSDYDVVRGRDSWGLLPYVLLSGGGAAVVCTVGPTLINNYRANCGFVSPAMPAYVSGLRGNNPQVNKLCVGLEDLVNRLTNNGRRPYSLISGAIMMLDESTSQQRGKNAYEDLIHHSDTVAVCWDHADAIDWAARNVMETGGATIQSHILSYEIGKGLSRHEFNLIIYSHGNEKYAILVDAISGVVIPFTFDNPEEEQAAFTYLAGQQRRNDLGNSGLLGKCWGFVNNVLTSPGFDYQMYLGALAAREDIWGLRVNERALWTAYRNLHLNQPSFNMPGPGVLAYA